MVKGSFRALIGMGIFLGGVALALVVAAQSPASGPNGRSAARLPAQLHLTQAQAQKIDEIRAKFEPKLLSLEEGVASKRRELETAGADPGVDPKAVARLRQEVGDLGGRLEYLQTEVDAAARAVLTSEQIALFAGGFDLFDGSWGWSCPWDRHWSHNAATDQWRDWGCDRWWCSNWQYSASSSRGHGDHRWGSDGGCCW